MKLRLIAVAIACFAGLPGAIADAAQSANDVLYSLPLCGEWCIYNLAYNLDPYDCSTVACACASPDFVADVRTCNSLNCTYSDGLATNSGFVKICSYYGVPLSTASIPTSQQAASSTRGGVTTVTVRPTVTASRTLTVSSTSTPTTDSSTSSPPFTLTLFSAASDNTSSVATPTITPSGGGLKNSGYDDGKNARTKLYIGLGIGMALVVFLLSMWLIQRLKLKRRRKATEGPVVDYNGNVSDEVPEHGSMSYTADGSDASTKHKSELVGSSVSIPELPGTSVLAQQAAFFVYNADGTTHGPVSELPAR